MTGVSSQDLSPAARAQQALRNNTQSLESTEANLAHFFSRYKVVQPRLERDFPRVSVLCGLIYALWPADLDFSKANIAAQAVRIGRDGTRVKPVVSEEDIARAQLVLFSTFDTAFPEKDMQPALG
jgi:hypothetical protein